MILLSTNRFTYDKNTKEFVAEISELPRWKGDLCVEDITLTSHITGKESDWQCYSVQRDPDGDILFWSLRPTKNTIAVHPGLAGVTALILND